MWPEGHLLKARKYQVIKQIGGGGFGLTYLVQDTRLKRQVVIKTPNRQFSADQDYEKFVRRFKREGQALSKSNHPNVVQVIEYFEEAGMPCLVMTYVEGETLNERIRNKGRLPQDIAVRCFRKLAEALHTLHQRGLIHCDVHPGNIILRPDGEPTIIDFGSAKLLQPGTFTVTTTVNESFAPYEQSNKENDPQPTLDVYALAATLYFAATGQKPQASMSRKMFGDKLQPPQQLCKDISDWLHRSILNGMALEANNRPTSMQAWLGSLHPPQSKVVQPSKLSKSDIFSPSKPAKSTPQKDSHRTRSHLQVPWEELILLGGYVPTGILLYLSFQETTKGIAFALAVALAVAVAVAGAGVGLLTVAGALTLAIAWAWALTVAVAVAGAGALALAVAVAVTGAGAVTRTVTVTRAGAGAILVGGIVGYSSSLGIWLGMGIGLLGFIQFFCVLTGLSLSVEKMKRKYPKLKVFIILVGVSILGMFTGGIVGWLFTLSSVRSTT